jgi:hypothetical protein
LFVVPPEDEDDPRPFPEADVERMLSHVLGFQHDEIVFARRVARPCRSFERSSVCRTRISP